MKRKTRRALESEDAKQSVLTDEERDVIIKRAGPHRVVNFHFERAGRKSRGPLVLVRAVIPREEKS